ncbi:glutamate/aspartate:proton symporter GltP [Apilactobacillus micheneri]|uniref:Glutamate/aspartate:proton symporter GltP n=1 Tax=Apilactobacillus micheneri TaxID=1899430 RepID=A0A9Q8IQ36_9LACO|nr:cation:dicarboxylase symporter family transporter [Apilactobacillus micheneri]TPR41175.1 glutamate/aspartate:proton symporter GltP [Apilactobacillus micheneri]TPR42756.1 glutamate/aspartate:proton symporter GltP [Apilactobacillus micheneri]TPR46282.1 glutamate/aspartate:proton symporter GltP [Apilactobacillus micheneri]TPR46967.1 glutamate/aspartate:proton symporter GltP [Apilactobacillus micheneri]TPR48559.1 glutamate/aspartate:proton symporter GltP [Apilactobacillus micheneri]
MKKIKLSLGWQILVGLILGIILGIIFYKNATAITAMQSIGTIFIRLIQMIVIPIVISCLTVGIASIGDIHKLGRIGGKTILYFELMTTIAIILGLIIGNIFHPGDFINVHALHGTDITQYLATAKSANHSGIWGTLIGLIPVNIFNSISSGDMMPIIVFSVLFGLGTSAIGEKGKVIIDLMESISQVMFKITGWIMKLSPIGVCALIGVTLAELGLSALAPLSYFVLLTYATMAIFVILVMGAAARIFGFRIFDLLKVVKEEAILAFSTASSEAALPRNIDKMTKFGVSPSIVSFVIPTGYTFNLDGSAIYQSLAALFLAQAYGIHLSIGQQITLLITLMITSKGMAGVPGASFVVLLATLSTVNIPISGMTFIAGIDRFIDMARTAVNVIGNSLATVIIGKSENEFDIKKEKAYMAKLK